MPTLIRDLLWEQRLHDERVRSGADRFDEVWEGVYMMAPMPNDEHQQIVSRLTSIFQETIDWPEQGHVRAGINVSDRRDEWMTNYRVPDLAVFLEGGKAENCNAFWLGGPDFVVEVPSPAEQIVDKIDFYSIVQARELLTVDRDPWCLELWRLAEDFRLARIARASLDGEEVESAVLPFGFKLQSGAKRPGIVVRHHDGKTWTV